MPEPGHDLGGGHPDGVGVRAVRREHMELFEVTQLLGHRAGFARAAPEPDREEGALAAGLEGGDGLLHLPRAHLLADHRHEDVAVGDREIDRCKEFLMRLLVLLEKEHLVEVALQVGSEPESKWGIVARVAQESLAHGMLFLSVCWQSLATALIECQTRKQTGAARAGSSDGRLSG